MSEPAKKEEFIIGRVEIADYLGIDPKTLDAWRAKYHPESDNPLPIGMQGNKLVTTKAKLASWRACLVSSV